MAQEDISSQQSSLWNPKIKLKFKKSILVSFFPSFSNSFAAFVDKEDANELNGEKK